MGWVVIAGRLVAKRGVGWLRLALEFILVRMVTVFVILRLVVGDFVGCYGWVI